MLTLVLILFAAAAVLGLIVLTALLKSKETPKAIVYLHGAIAAVGLLLLIVYAMDPASLPVGISLTLFIIAALGGFILFGRDFSGKPGPKWLGLVHGLVAVSAFLLLLVAALG